jgi:hypothetical protein
MDGDREAELDRRLEDREVSRLAVGSLRASAEKHLDEAWILANPTDLLGRLLRILRGADDRSAQALVPLEPVLADPVVVCAREGRRAVRARHERDEDGVVCVQHPGCGAGRVEQLPLDGLHALPRRPAVCSEILAVPGRGVCPRVARKPEVRLSAEPFPLRLLHVRKKRLGIADLRVDIAVDHEA